MEDTLTFIGTATTMLRMGDFTILTDPNFLHRGQRAYLGHGLWSRRRTEPALQPRDLPELDMVVLSHMHGDHFDRVARRGLDPLVPILTTGSAARKLHRSGFRSATGLAEWEAADFRRGDERLRVTAVPAVHGPPLLLPDVIGTVLELHRPGRRPLRVYVTGDTLHRPRLARIAERFPDLDAMVIHLGGTRILGLLVTMDGRQGAALTAMIRPATAIPVHHDDYPVFRSPLSDYVDAVRELRLPVTVQPVGRGEAVPLGIAADRLRESAAGRATPRQ